MRRKVVKLFTLKDQNRDRLTISDAAKIKLDPKLDQIQLRRLSVDPVSRLPVYSTDTDLTVETWTTTPQAVRSWLGFSATPRPTLQPAGTSLQYRLNDGTSDRWWNGAAWAVVALTTDWNDEATIAANIGSFPVTQSLKVIINLVTTDENQTPTLTEIAVLMDCEIDYLDSIIHDAVIPSLKTQFRPVLTFGMYAEGGTKVSLLDLETPFNIVSVVRVFDQTNDPQHATDILSSYTAADKTITLTTSVERGVELFLEYEIEPEVELNFGSQDYAEVEKLPSVEIARIDVAGNNIYGECSVSDISAATATVLRFPFRLNLKLDIVLHAEKNRTLLKMWDQVLAYSSEFPLLPWPAVDEEISMRTDVEQSFRPRPNAADDHSSTFSLLLSDIHLWLTPEEVIPLVQTFNLTVSKAEIDYPNVGLIKTEQF